MQGGPAFFSGAVKQLLAALFVSALTATAVVRPAAAFENAPDLYMVAGRDWRVVLPVSVLAAAGEKSAPVLLPELGKGRWFDHFISRYEPTRPALIVPTDGDGKPTAYLPWEEGPTFPEPEGGPIKLVDLSARVSELPLLLAEEIVPLSSVDPGPPVWIVSDADYHTGLLAAVAAGAERGILVPVAADREDITRALSFARARRAPVRLALSHSEESSPASSALKAAVLEAALVGDVPVEVVKGVDALTGRAAAGFAGLRSAELRGHVVFTNPADVEGRFSPPHLSLLAPLFAISRQASLVLTDGDPEKTERKLEAFEEEHGSVSHVTLIGDYLTLRMREMLDPDDVHEGVDEPRRFKVPSLAGVIDLQPAEYATGRLAAEDVHDLSLQIGRIMAPRRALGSKKRPALMLANADEIFVIAELVSMATVKEMRNTGWDVTAYYGDEIDRDLIFDEMPGKQVIIWTGHPRDLTVDYDIGVVDQMLDSSLVFLQGCYTLDRNDPYVLVQQGAGGIIGTYMAVYSASGSAFAKTVLDAMLYYGADQGEAMVHARNYQLAYVEMKRQRGHRDWRKTWRAALSFDLWGDPTLRSVQPRREPEKPPVRLKREGEVLRFLVPAERYSGLAAGRYTLESVAGGQLGAIYTRSDDWGDERRSQPFYFGWVDLPEHDEPPELESKVPDDEWVTVWAPKRQRLYILVHNRAERAVGREGLVFRLKGAASEEP